MISYAQNHEDVVLARALRKPTGFYIDVGAGSPVIHSVTNHFYRQGWRGVNVEPLALWHRQLVEARPRDVNLELGLGDAAGKLTFFDVSEEASEESTFSSEVADSLRARGLVPRVREVEVTTLAAVCEEYVDVDIDFLKVDVEGFELEVLGGGEWERFRPSVVVVESTEPGTSRPAGPEVVDFMESVGYVSALFDGLNRFYVRAEDAQLRELVSVPANVNDGFEDAELVDLRESIAVLLQDVERRVEEIDELRLVAERLATERDRVAKESDRAIVGLQERLEQLQMRLERAEIDVAAARREESDSRIQFQAAREALELTLAVP